MTPYPAVPRAFPGSTIICIATGPSLTAADVAACRGRAPVIVVNDAYKLAPWAEVLYAADGKWWTWEQGAPQFAGPKYALDPKAAQRPGVQVLEDTGVEGLELQPTGLRTGRNSGYQAINLAVHLGAARIVLLGYDMSPAPDGRTHFFGDHPDKQPSPYAHFLAAFQTIVAPLAAAGVSVVNCSRRTVLTAFPCAALEHEVVRLERVA